jgi:hypothetical protein
MIEYIKNSEISIRIGLNPFYWIWFPRFQYEKPSKIYPKRRTFAIIFLGFQFYLDVDDGTHDMSAFERAFGSLMDAYDEKEVGHPISPASTRSVDLE